MDWYIEQPTNFLIGQHLFLFAIVNKPPAFHKNDAGDLWDNIVQVVRHKYDSGAGLCDFA